MAASGIGRSSLQATYVPIWDSSDPARNPPPLPLPRPGSVDLSLINSVSTQQNRPPPLKGHRSTNSMKLDHLYFKRQSNDLSLSNSHSHTHSQSSSTILQHVQQPISSPQQKPPTVTSIQPDLNKISEQLVAISISLSSLLRRSKDNGLELSALKSQISSFAERENTVINEIKSLMTSTSNQNPSIDLKELFDKLDELRLNFSLSFLQAQPLTPPSSAITIQSEPESETPAHSSTLSVVQSAENHLITLAESIDALGDHINSLSNQFQRDCQSLQDMQQRRTILEYDLGRLDAILHQRKLEYREFIEKAESLEGRILKARTALQVSGARAIKMKKSSPSRSGATSHQHKPSTVDVSGQEGSGNATSSTPITPQRRILSLSSANRSPLINQKMPNMAELGPFQSTGIRKTSWSKRLGGIFDSLTGSEKENGDLEGSVLGTENETGEAKKLKRGSKILHLIVDDEGMRKERNRSISENIRA